MARFHGLLGAVLGTLACLYAGTGLAQAPARISDDVVKLGLIMDMSGPFADITGPGSVAAARMAVEDFGGKVLGRPIQVLSADHQNKADIAAAKAREWFASDRLDAIVDVTASAPALAVLDVAKLNDRIVMLSGPGALRITNEACGPNVVHYAYDTYALSHGTGAASLRQGYDTWFFITADYAFGHELERDTREVVTINGGKVLGSARVPLNTADFSSFLLQARASRAKAIGLANSGADTINAIKQAVEFGLPRGGQRLVGLLVYINDVHGLGLQAAQGMLLTEGFYWDMNDETRAWSRRYFERTGKMPNMSQAGVYSSVTHYLRAVEATGTDETAAVMRAMKATPINDFFARNGRIREDGRMVHDMYLFEVKQPSESSGAWDLYKLVRTIPGDEAFQPIEKSRCPLLRNR